MPGDGGARIRPETLPRRKIVGRFQFRTFIKKTGNTTEPINPLVFQIYVAYEKVSDKKKCALWNRKADIGNVEYWNNDSRGE